MQTKSEAYRLMMPGPKTTARIFSGVAVVTAACAWAVCGSSWAIEQRLVSDPQARHLGLERAWFAQVRLDPARNKVERAVLNGDRLTVLTTAGVVQEFDALTGRTFWIAPIGNPDFPSLGPAANSHYVALLNGSTLYVLDQKDGKPILIRPVGGAPGAAPAISEKYVFVPLVMGRIEAYPLGVQKLTPWYYQSIGRTMVAPLTTPESVVWTTDSGHLYVGRSLELGVRFRLETGSEILAPPSYGAPYVYAATSNGEVFSIHEQTGDRHWKYATGFPIVRPPAVIGDRVYVTSEEPALHCVEAEHGTELWVAPHIEKFAAASAKRVYAVSELGALLVLDAMNGAVLGRMRTGISTDALVNDQTDRVYLISDDGVIQCFREIGSKEPVYHRPKVEPKKTPSATSGRKPAAGTTPPAAAAQPAEEGAEEGAGPAEGAEETPAEEGAGMDEDPFETLEN
jgi:outer membrane protein assembly factor BamB